MCEGETKAIIGKASRLGIHPRDMDVEDST